MGFRDFFTRMTHDTMKEPRKLVVKKQRCPQNHHCPAQYSCPVGAISQVGYAAPKINYNICVGCGKCTRYCFPKALVMEKI